MLWSRDVGARSELSLSASRDFVDVFSDGRFGGSAERFLTRDIFKEELATLAYTINGERSSIVLTGSLADVEYTTESTRDYNEVYFSAEYRRALTRRIDLEFFLSVVEREFDATSLTDDIDRWRLLFRRDIGTRYSADLSFERFKSDAVTTSSVDENVVTLYFTIALTAGATP